MPARRCSRVTGTRRCRPWPARSPQAASYFDTLFFVFIAIVGWKASVGLFDAFARGQSDMTYYFVPGAKQLKMAQLYGLYLWGVIIFGIIILNFGPADGPAQILDILAFLSAFVMGAYCLTLAAVNNRTCRRRSGPIRSSRSC